MHDAVVAAAPLADRQTLLTGFIALCREHGFHNVSQLARALGIAPQYALRLAKRSNGALLRASLLCLGDGRLRQFPQSAPLGSFAEPETPL